MSNQIPHSRLFVLQENGPIGKLTERSGVAVFEQLPNTRCIGSVITLGRLRFSLIIFFTLLFIFFVRSVQLQIFQGNHFRALAESNKYRTERLVPQRGLIFDRNGIVLAQNIPSFVLTMTIADLPKNEQKRYELFDIVSKLAGVQPTDLDLLMTQYAKNQTEAIPVKRNINFERAMNLEIEIKNLQGFNLQTSTLRMYPQTIPSLSHILGYTGKITEDDLSVLKDQGYKPIDVIGKTGVERVDESLLRGQPGEVVTEVDARGKELTVVSRTNPVVGANLTLTIDSEFQKFIETRLEKTMQSVGSTKGSVVVLNPKNGEVYALVSLPTFDNNLFAQGIEEDTYKKLADDKDQPLFFRAIAGEFPSGSTFKPFVAYAALVEKIINENTSFLSTGGIRINEWFFPDWKAGGHGITNVRKALAESVNTFFYIIGGGLDQINGLGVERITDYARRFGFGKPTGIDLPSEADGFLPSKEWKEEVKGERWYVGDTYHLAIGQGDLLTTPLQMAHATGIIANKGVDVLPHVVNKINDVEKDISSQTLDSLDSYALSVVRQGMRQTVTQGSARSLSVLPVSVAGKTGTAQAPGHEKYHSWFTGFAPYEDSEIALAIIVEDGGESTDAAVPLAKEIIYWWLTNRR
ncbi:penicillin-binding protein 2 [Candidatus Uhrbacteria bacterium]|nr:penicillin-binding protein 2 [Candidatus Uhrbacteria bacterium]